ncbi:MAG: GNAT family N-acetyltransferase [Gemmatimonadaceae bacterium]
MTETESVDDLSLRHARMKDVPRLEAMIAESVRALSAGYYSAEQVESALRFVFGVDTQLIADRTYYVIEGSAGFAACGGWSKRQTLYGGDQHKSDRDPLLDPRTSPARIRAFFVHPSWARRGLGQRLYVACRNAAEAAGFTAFELGATLPGVPLYTRLGFEPIERIDVTMPDGVELPIVRMRRMI